MVFWSSLFICVYSFWYIILYCEPFGLLIETTTNVPIQNYDPYILKWILIWLTFDYPFPTTMQQVSSDSFPAGIVSYNSTQWALIVSDHLTNADVSFLMNFVAKHGSLTPLPYTTKMLLFD